MGVYIAMNKGYKSFAAIGNCMCVLLLIAGVPNFPAQDEPTHLRVNVVLVQLSIAVTDRKGNYVAGLRPEDFVITEDKIPQKIANFEEGSDMVREASQGGKLQSPCARS